MHFLVTETPLRVDRKPNRRMGEDRKSYKACTIIRTDTPRRAMGIRIVHISARHFRFGLHFRGWVIGITTIGLAARMLVICQYIRLPCGQRGLPRGIAVARSSLCDAHWETQPAPRFPRNIKRRRIKRLERFLLPLLQLSLH